MAMSGIIRSPVRAIASSGLAGGQSLLGRATSILGGIEPLHYWDFTTNRALFNRNDVGGVASTPGWSFTRATVGTAENAAGEIIQFASGELRRTDRGVLIEGARTNLFLNSATGVTQSITVAAAAHTLSFRGTGTITLSGVSTAGPLVGTGANNRVTLTFTPTAGSLTLTVTGSCTNVQLEAGAFASSWIPTAGASVARNADVLTVSSPGVDFPLSLWAEFERAVDTGGTERLHTLDNGTEAENANIGMNASDLFRAAMTDGGVLQAGAPVAGALAVGTVYKGAGRFALNSVQSALNGTLGTEDTIGTVPTTPTNWRFGAGSDGLVVSYGYLRRAAIFNTALSDANLQAVTA